MLPHPAMHNIAIQDALNLYRQPTLVHKMECSELPHDIITVLKVVSRSDDLSLEAAAELGSTPRELRAACILYLQTVVFHQAASDARLLALTTTNNPSQLRDHKRLLLKWLHPDRNNNTWENKLFLRIQAAAERLAKHEPQSDMVNELATSFAGRSRRHSPAWHIAQRRQAVWKHRSLSDQIKKFALGAFALIVGFLLAGAVIYEVPRMRMDYEVAN